MILPRLHTDTLSLENVHSVLFDVVHDDLISALSDLSLPVIHEAPSESVYLVVPLDTGVALPPKDFIIALILLVAPLEVVP